GGPRSYPGTGLGGGGFGSTGGLGGAGASGGSSGYGGSYSGSGVFGLGNGPYGGMPGMQASARSAPRSSTAPPKPAPPFDFNANMLQRQAYWSQYDNVTKQLFDKLGLLSRAQALSVGPQPESVLNKVFR